MKRTYNLPDTEPTESNFKIPSEKEHLFQIVDVIDNTSELGQKLKLDDDSVSVKLEVCGGDESGLSLLQRLTLDDNNKGFFATRIFLKALGYDYKGKELIIDTNMWVGCQFYATVVHNGKYANIKEYNFDKKVDNSGVSRASSQQSSLLDPKDIQWDN